MSTLTPYLNFNGNTEEAFNFYRSVFGGEFAGVMRWKDMPGSEKLSDADKNKIMHIALPVGKDGMLMATDNLEAHGPKVEFGTNCQIMIAPESRDDADRIFRELSAGGKVEMPMDDTFWGAYFGAFTDKFGVKWLVHYQKGGGSEAG